MRTGLNWGRSYEVLDQVLPGPSILSGGFIRSHVFTPFGLSR